MNNNISLLILKGLVNDEEYCRKVLPFLKREYFDSNSDKVIFETIYDFITAHNTLPTIESLSIILAERPIPAEQYKQVEETLSTISDYTKPNIDWFLSSTEKFCRDQSIINAFRQGISIIDGKDKKNSIGILPELMKDALSVSFNTSIGHSYTEDYQDRLTHYHTKEEQIPFDLEILNKITNGGIPKKTLNIIMAGTGVGKSTFLSHLACAYFSAGYNVFYATFEMSKEKTSERFDANLLDIPINELKNIPQQIFDNSFKKILVKSPGKIIVEEYPTSSANVMHVEHTLNELELKKNFKPDVIILDYLNIMLSSRIKTSPNNMYTYVKYIAEEVRGLAVKRDVPIWTATQLNREGFKSSDVGLENTSESFGVPATADLMWALISNDELEKQNQIMVKQLKNRYNETFKDRKFILGVDRPKMRFFEVENSAQDQIIPHVNDYNRNDDFFQSKGILDKFDDFKF